MVSLAGVTISAKRVQLITERVGATMMRERDAATASFLTSRSKASRPVEPAALMVITADGGRVQTRQKEPTQKWKEDKVGVVYDAIPTPEKPGEKYRGPKPNRRSVTATLASWDVLGDHLGALGEKRGYHYARQKVFISDGALSIRSLRERCFPDAVFILDWAHAAEHLNQCAIAIFGPGPKATRWYERQKERLWNGHTKRLIAEIARQSRRQGRPAKSAQDNDPCRILRNHLTYFRGNRLGLDYPAFRKKGWPIGSGIIESTIKQIAKRVKGSEKHWTITGAEETLQVVTQLLSEDDSWQNFWRRCPLASVA